MAKGFDENVSKVRPRLRIGRVDVQDGPTDPPPLRAEESSTRRSSFLRSFIDDPSQLDEQTEDSAAADGEPRDESASSDETPAAHFHPEEHIASSEPEVPEHTAPIAIGVTKSVPDVAPVTSFEKNEQTNETPAVNVPVSLPQLPVQQEVRVHQERPRVQEIEREPVARQERPESTHERLKSAQDHSATGSRIQESISSEYDAASTIRRSALKRRAAGVGAVESAESMYANTAAVLSEIDMLESTTQLAAELERALTQASDANEQLRHDLNQALDDLAHSAADTRRFQERIDRLEAESEERVRVVQDLLNEMDLLENERDSALTQSADAALAHDAMTEKMALLERRSQEFERTLAESHMRMRRFEEAAQTHAAQRAALRAESEALRQERDQLLVKNAELERDKEELMRSRQALDEVHRALSEARQRAQRIRPR